VQCSDYCRLVTNKPEISYANVKESSSFLRPFFQAHNGKPLLASPLYFSLDIKKQALVLFLIAFSTSNRIL